MEEEYARAAALATFHLHLTRAIQLVSRVSNPGLSIVSLALAGYEGGSGLWKQACVESRQKLTDPYLKAIFGFLTNENDNYDAILVS